MKNKKGISPIVATALLIVMVVVIALIVFLWMRNLQEEAITKFGKNIELVCNEVSFDASCSEGLQISNNGNVPIIDMKIQDGGSLIDLATESEWPERGLRSGAGFSDDISFDDDKIKIIPVLRGTTESGQKDFICDERYGVELNC